jgi:hypothetical protein
MPVFDVSIVGKLYLPEVGGGPIYPPGVDQPKPPLGIWGGAPIPWPTPPIYYPPPPLGIWGGAPIPWPTPPIYYPPAAPGAPTFPIWGPPGFNPPGAGYPPGIWAGPIVIPTPPPTEPPAEGAKPPPPEGGWGYHPEYGWGYFPPSGGKPQPGA